MRLRTRERHAGEIEFGILYGSIAVFALAAARVVPAADLLPSCAFLSITGIPCPTCGTTRALIHLSHGDIAHALSMNPVFALALIGALLFLLYNSAALFSRSRLSLSVTSREASFLRWGAAALLLGNWAYLVLSI